jgi:hypothetical protein
MNGGKVLGSQRSKESRAGRGLGRGRGLGKVKDAADGLPFDVED